MYNFLATVCNRTLNLMMDVHLLSRMREVEPQIVDLFCGAMFLVGIIVYLVLQYLTANYGRYSYYSNIFKFGINARLAWFSQEVPSFGIPVAFIWIEHQKIGHFNFTKLALVGLFILHYWQRTFIYSFLIRGGKPTPFIIWTLAFLFCTVNGYIQVRSIQLQQFPNGWFKMPFVLLGTALFFVGFFINIHSDYILRNLRKPGETGYKIPQGGMFEYVTAANYLGETIEWFGYFLAVQTTASAAFFFFTVCNLWPRAFRHHRWYKEKFDDYPADRTAIVPLVL